LAQREEALLAFIGYNRFHMKQLVFALRQISLTWRGEMDWILGLVAGALAGSLVSMTGSGAGFLLVPGLSLALSFSAFPSADLFKIAVATTHGANLITNLAAFQAHAVPRSIDWSAFIRLGPGSIAGPQQAPFSQRTSIRRSLNSSSSRLPLRSPRGCYASTGNPPRRRRRRLECG
jgi:hypothetical protein